MTDTTLNDSRMQDHWKPNLIKSNGTMYDWPPRFLTILKWLKNFLLAPVNLFHAGLGLVVWFFLTPDLARMQTFELDWVFTLYFRNVALLVLVVGIAHFRLYIQKAQGIRFKFNPKWPETNSSKFLFGDQTWDNMFWGIVSGCGIWTIYEAITYWMFANEYVLFPIEWLDSPLYMVLLFLAIPHIRQHHFYFAHRLTHWKPLYKSAHFLHHKNTNTGPWSGLSMHPIEHLIYFSGVLLHWIIPSHPIHASFHLMHTGVSPTWGHCGFEKIKVNGSEMKLGNYFHYLHHRYFECNYGNPAVPWDKLFGTFNDGSDEAMRAMQERMKKMHG